MSIQRLFGLEGKVAVVTGGSRGIGRMIAQGFVENGVRTYITARNAEELGETAEALSEFGECLAVPADLSSVEGLKAFCADIAQRESKLHILVNNAGAVWGAPIDEFPESGFDKVINLNLKAPFFMIKSMLPLLRAAGAIDDPARIVNISSINGMTHSGNPNYSYSASKAGLIHLTRQLAADLACDHVLVNGIAPGLFRTKTTEFALRTEVEREKQTAQIPLGRLGCYEDAAGTAIYLCSRASAFVSGHTVVLDGGVVAAS
ncbi:MAG: NAD(P)-dependent dehydrogenase (short-subunit alcohol dehydrogenase family) [Bermanella sp.]|jgi:NAD(P)-dependent dehydrogenase (short-subunit alcohol dehydrogenase family)